MHERSVAIVESGNGLYGQFTFSPYHICFYSPAR